MTSQEGTFPKRKSKVISHSASILSTYEDGRPIGRSGCAETSWLSDTSMTCKLQAGSGDLRAVELTVFRQQNSLTPSLDKTLSLRSVAYASPQPVNTAPASAPGAAGTQVTVFGHQFGTYDTSPRARLAGTACAATTWLSDSSLLCKVPVSSQIHPFFEIYFPSFLIDET